MKLEILLILCIISACVGGGIGRFLFCKPLNIEFKISSLDSFMYAFAMFFVINATSVQLIPSSVMGLRTTMGSISPADIILPTILATLLSTVIGVILVRVFCRR